MSDRVAILRAGAVEQFGPPQALYRRPATVFAATFLGEANLVPVTGDTLHGFGARLGASGTAVLRPEDLDLVPPTDPAGYSVEGTVGLSSFQGARYRLDVGTERLGRLLVSLPPGADRGVLVPGSRVRVVCRAPERIHVIPGAGPGRPRLEPAPP
jgi:putative spermidine/putrescine transport system ATP-binding protein